MKDSDRKITRRQMAKDSATWLGKAAVSIYLGRYLSACASFQKSNAGISSTQANPFNNSLGFFPIEAINDSQDQVDFSGDGPKRPHSILWQRDQYISERQKDFPKEPERIPLAILGGGLSGLSSAYLLRQHKPVLLEQHPQVGGNSRGESWNGISYSIGAAYFANPEEDSLVKKFLLDSDAWKLVKTHTADPPFEYEGKILENFWDGPSASKDRSDFLRVKKLIDSHANETNGKIFPDIPILDPKKAHATALLDRMNFIQYLEKETRSKLHPHIRAALEFYCWSSFGGSASEISAAQGLNFYAGESDGTAVFPGGNAGLTQHLTNRLVEDLGSNHIRTGSIVFDVNVTDEGVDIYYETPEQKIGWIRAKAAVCAMPKFIAKRVFRDFEPERTQAISELKYTSYLVANLLVSKPKFRDFYDMFLLGTGNVNTRNLQMASNTKGTTDIVLGSYASNETDRCVYTLYRPIPYLGARASLYSSNAFSTWKSQFENEIETKFLPLLNLKRSDIKSVRITRWGHPLPVAQKGLIANRTLEKIFKPFRDRVFFVHQDNWALPALETCITEAITWSKKVNERLS